MTNNYDVIVIGGGPAGLAAALAADKKGSSVLLIEREAKLGGILKQCIHDGFGVVRFGEKLSGPEYAYRFVSQLGKSKVEVKSFGFVTSLTKTDDNLFRVVFVNGDGVGRVTGGKIILATGCRERTANQITVTGDRGAGIFTAGAAQNLVNISGVMPTKRCVILGSGDIGLIMARRLTLEGAKVVGVFEAKSTPSGLTRNIHQCLYDFDIPLTLSATVTRVIGKERVEAVEITDVDEKMNPKNGTERIIPCDALILAVGLIPENEVAASLGTEIDPRTKGPYVDQHSETSVKGVYCCGNALHVNDLVDYVSESGETAGFAASEKSAERSLVSINVSNDFLYAVPQKLDINSSVDDVVMFFRSRDVVSKKRVKITVDGKTVFEKKYPKLLPPEMERIQVSFGSGITDKSIIEINTEDY